MVTRICPLGKWPYFELRVSLLDELRSRIHFCIDLIIADGTSIDFLIKQLFCLYTNPSQIPQKLEVSFCDYIASLEKYKETGGYRKKLQYWEKKFREIPPGPRLPVFEWVQVKQTEGREGMLRNWEALKRKADKMFVSPNLVLLTAFTEILAAWSDHGPFTVVIPSWQRRPLHPKINEIVGDFTAMSWLVIEETEKSFAEKVVSIHKAVQEDLSQIGVSGLTVLRKLIKNKKKEDLVFPVVFSEMSIHSNFALPQGFKFGKILSQTPQVYLDNISFDQGRDLYLHWSVATGIYPKGMIEEMFLAYQRLLGTLVNDPQGLERRDFSRIIDAKPQKYKKNISYASGLPAYMRA